jgi:hypothetical protein
MSPKEVVEQLHLLQGSGRLNANQEQLVKDVLKTMDSLEKMREALTNGMHRRCREVLGERYEEALCHPELAPHYLADADPNVRQAALSLMQVVWDNAGEHEGLLRRLAEFDPDERVRHAAMGHLSVVLAKQPARRFGSVLAKVVRDEGASRSLRRAAYHCLAGMFALPLSAHGRAGMVNLATEVDWPFVNQLASEGMGEREAVASNQGLLNLPSTTSPG